MSKGKFGERDEANYNWDLAIKRNSLFFGDEAIVGIICHKDEQTEQIQKIERFVAEKEKRGKKTVWVKKQSFPVSGKSLDKELQKYGQPFQFGKAFGYFEPDEEIEPV